jgi:hypothetical protein
VKCLELCSEFNYPLRKTDLQNLVQAYCVENSVNTRFVLRLRYLRFHDNVRYGTVPHYDRYRVVQSVYGRGT